MSRSMGKHTVPYLCNALAVGRSMGTPFTHSQTHNTKHDTRPTQHDAVRVHTNKHRIGLWALSHIHTRRRCPGNRSDQPSGRREICKCGPLLSWRYRHASPRPGAPHKRRWSCRCLRISRTHAFIITILAQTRADCRKSERIAARHIGGGR